jgi:tripartite-type tricarboxylate transporter receptor subunit TctC
MNSSNRHFHRNKLKSILALSFMSAQSIRGLAQPSGVSLGTGSAATVVDYPNRVVKWICPSSSGAGTDAAARIFAQVASDAWKQSCIVDNRSGASGMIGLEMLSASAPDGYTLGLVATSQLISGVLKQKFTFEEKRDFTPISLLATVPLVLVTSKASGIKSLNELISYAKSNPNKLNYSSGGSGGHTHLAMEVFLAKLGLKVSHVPYKGSALAVGDVVAGHVQLSFATPAAISGFVKDGRLNAIGVASDTPSELISGVPTLLQLGVQGVSSDAWYGLFAPAHLPLELVKKISSSLIAASKTAQVKEKLLANGMEPMLSSPAEFTQFLEREKSKWLTVTKNIGFNHEG